MAHTLLSWPREFGQPNAPLKPYTSAFKIQVVLELLKDEKSLNQLASEYSVHPNIVRDWKAVALKGFPALFERCDTLADTTVLHEQQLQDLYAQIGRLTTQLAWIKKIWPRP